MFPALFGRSVPTQSLRILVLFFVLASLLETRLTASASTFPFITVLSAEHNAQQSDKPEFTHLEPGTPVEREVAPGQKHFYQLTLSAGQFLKLAITQAQTTVAVTVRLPNGEAYPWVYDAQPYIHEWSFGFLPQVSGTYQLEISTKQSSRPGQYKLSIAELRTATDNDRAYDESRKLFTEFWRMHRQGKALEARSLITRALEIRERLLPPDDPVIATTLGFLASTYSNTGEFAKAEELNRRALSIVEKVYGPDHPAAAEVLIKLGRITANRGDSLRAEELYLKAHKIFTHGEHSESYEVSALSGSLGALYYDRGDYVKAEKFYLQSRAILEKLFGPEHFHLVDSYTHLGRVAYDSGDNAKAVAMFKRALALGEKALDTNHLSLTNYRNQLAAVYVSTGEYSEAEGLYNAALSAHQIKSAMASPALLDTLYGLARLYSVQGRLSDAVSSQRMASELEERFVDVNLAVGTERERMAFLDSLASHASQTISLHTMVARDSAEARELALTAILQRKGRLQDTLADSLGGLRQRFGAEDRKLLVQFDETTSKLAKLVLNGPQNTNAEDHKQHLKAIEQQREALEAEVSKRSSGSYQPTSTITLKSIRSLIPSGTALVEFAVYRRYDVTKPDNATAFGEPRYVVYVLGRDGEIRWADLGDASPIDAAIQRWRTSLRDPARKDTRQLGQAVEERLMRPVRRLVGSAKRLLISPDGALNLIPFAALANEKGTYLVEDYALSYLTSGRDLLRMEARRESRSGEVVVADPAFGEPAVLSARAAGRDPGDVGSAARLDYTQMFFGPLPGVGDEVRALKELMPQASILTRENATKAALKDVRAPSILHIATHGFFLSEPRAGATESIAREEVRGIKSNAKIENPLLRAGLALAGANRGASGEDNGVLTAFEAAHLDLWGTKLVVLSACDTGVGEVRNGDGVYGLRRALVLAGAESQMVSLWPVSDRSTRDLMIAYYRGLAENEGRSEALRRAQLRMLQGKEHAHPYYWASFIQTGDWRNLKGTQ